MRLATAPRAGGNTFESALDYLKSRERELIPVSMSALVVDGETGDLRYGDQHFALSPLAAKQLCTRLKIASAYVMKIDNGIAAENFNTFLPHAVGHGVLAVEDGSTVTGILRGERAMPIDPEAMVEAIQDRMVDGYRLGKWQVDERGLSFRMVTDRLVSEPRLGDVVEAGVDLVSQENVDSSISVRGVLYRLVCTNGAVSEETAGLRAAMRRTAWQDPSARIELALACVEETVEKMGIVNSTLPRLSRHDFELPGDPDERMALIRTALAAIPPRGIKSRSLAEAVSDALWHEEPSLFGLYNAVTRLGRDSIDAKIAQTFESAGYHLAINPDSVVAALAELA